jgi:hypothetical protein
MSDGLNPYEAPRSPPANASHVPLTRRQRIVALTIDSAPLVVAIFYALAPIVSLLAMAAWEGLTGVGIFDPQLGGDPLLVIQLPRAQSAAVLAAGALTVWLALQTTLVFVARVSMGRLIVRAAVGPSPPSRAHTGALVLLPVVAAITLVATAWLFARRESIASPFTRLAMLAIQTVVVAVAVRWSAKRL